ncbi:MAG: class I SAM-dependent methyltransferase [Firmicutes bacterium]|nr:class I SAM-dependent methyltransferase [Bacillota bacterium]
MNSVKDYLETVKAPWGRMLYDLLFTQLSILSAPKARILDFGSGLGVTANYYARWYCVTAIEPDMEMIENRYRENDYTQILGGVEQVGSFSDNFFDIIFCHNVLEYVNEREPILQSLLRVLKPGGALTNILGMRTFWALGQDNSVKLTGEWYENMLVLETKAAEIDEYRQSAFLNHLLFEKRAKTIQNTNSIETGEI